MRYIRTNSTKDAHELHKGNSRAEQGDLEEMNLERSTTDSLHYRCATLIRKSTTVQAPGSEHRDLGESENSPTSGKMSAKRHVQAGKCVHDQVM